MSELSAGLRELEVQERAAYFRERARRELVGVREERPSRLRALGGRRVRRAA